MQKVYISVIKVNKKSSEHVAIASFVSFCNSHFGAQGPIGGYVDVAVLMCRTHDIFVFAQPHLWDTSVSYHIWEIECESYSFPTDRFSNGYHVDCIDDMFHLDREHSSHG